MKNQKDPQQNIFKILLQRICDQDHPLIQLADRINWRTFEEEFGPLYCQGNGRPAMPIRLMVGLHYLKSMFSESDEGVVEKWVENPYWQYFCGEIEFQHEFPIEPTTLGKWRKRVKSSGMEKLLEVSIEAGQKSGVIKRSHLKRVNVDTTVQEKAITFPTDAKLYHRMREKLVKEAKQKDIRLRQTYTFKSKKALFKQNRYRHARQGKRANRELRRLKTYFGRVIRDIDRKARGKKRDQQFEDMLALGYRLLAQKRKDKNKIYSLHAPEVECIAKGKAHKRYEFGCKASYVTSSKGNFILGAQALHGNPYDGHTLKSALDQAQRLIGKKAAIENAYVDLGYRGSTHERVNVHVVNWRKKKIKQSLRRWFKRRAAIEPLIGHTKNDGGSKRNHLHGEEGDRMNVLLLASGFNMRKCLRAFSFCAFRLWLWVVCQMPQRQLITQMG